MTKEEIIRMARETGFETKVLNSIDGEEVLCFDPIITDMLKDFAVLVAYKVGTEQYKAGYAAGKRNEREACAKVCEDLIAKGYQLEGELDLCAADIRARS